MKYLRVALLSVPPILGLVAIAAARASWPDRLIVGKWHKSAPDTTIEIRADGTYEELGWKMLSECRPVYAPYVSVPQGCEHVETRRAARREWGRYSFVARDRIDMNYEGEEIEREDRNTPAVHPCRRVWFGCGVGMHGDSAPDAVVINGDEARVGGEIWKRMK